MTDLSIQEIMQAIPHRYPFLLIDRLVDIIPSESAVGIKNVTINEQFFNGHFPQAPVMPGVLIIEAMAQTAGVLVIHSIGSITKQKLVYFMSIESAKFRRPVVPGDRLELRVRIIQHRGAVWKVEGKAFVGDTLCAEAIVTAMISDSKDINEIHETALVHPKAKLGKNIEIGAYSVIGPNVELANGVKIHSHVNIEGYTTIGENTEIYPFASIGSKPQDLKYKGEPSRLVIGKNNQIREHVTMNPGTEGGGNITQVGDNCLFMMATHVAHDCKIGNGVILANHATLAGHVTIEDGAILGGLVAVQQFIHIGRGAMIGGCTGVNQDVIPYAMVYSKDRGGQLKGINLVGLERRGHTKDAVLKLQQFVRDTILNPVGNFKENITKSTAHSELIDEVRQFLNLDHKHGILKDKDEKPL